jgi:hypothetical protein
MLKELRRELRKHGAKLSGRKYELVERYNVSRGTRFSNNSLLLKYSSCMMFVDAC